MNVYSRCKIQVLVMLVLILSMGCSKVGDPLSGAQLGTTPSGGVGEIPNDDELDPPSDPDAGTDGDDGSVPDGNDPDLEAEPFSVVAHKTYRPTVFENGIFRFEDGLTRHYLIPNEVEVTVGNAGNHSLWIRFLGVPGVAGNQVICFYQGGSELSKPIQKNDAIEIEKGLVYQYRNEATATLEDQCRTDTRTDLADPRTEQTNALTLYEAGATIEFHTVEVHIEHGDNTRGVEQTQVSAYFEPVAENDNP